MSDIEKELELEFKKAELKRKQLENRKFEAEIRMLELDVELKEQVQEYEIQKAEADSLKHHALAKREASNAKWLMIWLGFITAFAALFENLIAMLKRLFGF